jgi:hypothetical protein
MVAKKPLGGWSCLNCSKNITNMSGTLADFVVQNRFPNRDPNERLNKQIGFSKYMHRFDQNHLSDDENSSLKK